MIDAFYIFTKGGLLLWSTQLVKVNGNPLDRLIKEVLLEERVGETNTTLDSYSLKWKLLNDMDIFFVVVYQGILQIAYLEGLLETAAKNFLTHIVDDFGNGMKIKKVDFDADFRKLLQKVDKDFAESKRRSVMKSFSETKKGLEVLKNKDGNAPAAKPSKKGKDGKGEDEDGGEGGDEGATAEATESARAKLRRRTSVKEKEAPKEERRKSVKEARMWGEGKVSKSSMDSLDHSRRLTVTEEQALGASKLAEFKGSDDDFMNSDDAESLSSSSDSGEDVFADKKDAGGNEKKGRVAGLYKSLTRSMKNITGGAVLTDEDLEPILKTFRTNLMAKNVAADVAMRLSDSVRTSLVGKTTDRFTSMNSTVKAVLQEAMENLLTPKKSIDVLRAAIAAKNAGRVYSVCFLGVNGVGKSTNLAKVAYYLKNKGNLSVLICACDTFRAGAVEQLKTHCKCLDIPLYERGYGKDPAEIAKGAINHAKSEGIDVVLIDTAGRMQDNEPLMRALAKLVALNNPDLVLFVGEALVGNDAIDQVTKFNRSLIDMSHDPRHPRGLDGMLLTKYDTVDDKVGAALSMVYVTGQPIVFVGTGQKYTHLRKMQAKEVVRTLLG